MSSIEAKRVQFRKYLENVGIIDAMSKALIKLYEEQNKPEDAVRFVRKLMCENCPDESQHEQIKIAILAANEKIRKLRNLVDQIKFQITKTDEELAEELETGFREMLEDEETAPSMLRKHMTREVLDEYMQIRTPPPYNSTLFDCIQSGLLHHDSSVGVYAADPECYTTYTKLFEPIIREYHGLIAPELTDEEIEAGAQPEEDTVFQKDTDWGNLEDIEPIDNDCKYVLSTRIRIARNIAGFPHFMRLREKQYREIEEKVKLATAALEDDLAGNFISVADLDLEKQEDMVKRHLLFESGNAFLTSAGCYHFWPIGRGVFLNTAETFMVWVNEEDHLRIISLSKCGDLSEVYSRLVRAINVLEQNLEFTRHPRYGYITACPTNLGTTMRASVHIRLPLLSQDWDRLQQMANELNLQIRGTGGEHTAIQDGVMDISNRRRLGVTEIECVKGMHEGIKALIKAEEELAGGGDN